jgi:hypothetical protein
MSTIGVPFTALSSLTRNRPAVIVRTRTRCNPSGLGAVGRTRVEDSLPRSGQIPARMRAQNVTPRPVEPGEDQDLVALLNAVQSVEEPRLEHEPRLWRAFVGLLGRGSQIPQRRLNRPDGAELHLQRMT